MCPVCLVTVRTDILSCLSSYCEDGYMCPVCLVTVRTDICVLFV